MYNKGSSLRIMEKKKLYKLYVEKKLSMQQIADLEGCSLNKIAYWIGKHDISSRSRSEAVYLRANPDGDPFRLRELNTKEDFLLLGLGLGLFWGEGSKAHDYSIRLGNSDPRLIKCFLRFLSDVFGVDRSRIKFGLQIFDDQSSELVKRKWINAIGFSGEHFLPSVVITEKRGIGTYRRKNEWGVLTIYFSNVKLRKILDEYMEKYAY